ncbi:MAG: hypothetical protein ACP5LB_00485 [Candidatus Bathyarchaeia archaeon]
MSASLQRKALGALTSATPQTRELNAETVTTIATGFLKRIGNKGSLKPKRVSLEEGIYTVEVELKKFIALVKVDSETHGIKEYEIQPKGEETPFISVSPKIIAMIFGFSAVVYVALYFAFRLLGL